MVRFWFFGGDSYGVVVKFVCEEERGEGEEYLGGGEM